jgi:hypothetical protein
VGFVFLLVGGSAEARTITVDTLVGTSAEDEECSIHEAIEAANTDAPQFGCPRGDGADTIVFDIPDPGSLIEVESSLPAITERVVLDGSSEPDPGNDHIFLENHGPPGPGLVLQAGRSTIRGLVITDFTGDGITIEGNRNRVATCRVGTKSLLDEGNGGNGISIDGDSNRIGGGAAASGNLVSANGGVGVSVAGEENIVRNNHVGTINGGLSGLGNADDGIQVEGRANVIGPGNVASANGDDGIHLEGGRNIVRGNITGLTADGEVDIGNTDMGINVRTKRNVVGGARAVDRNVVSGNGEHGIEIDTDGEPGRNRVLGNYVGLDDEGDEAVGNEEDGISMEPSSNNTIGGDEAGEGNVVSANGENGIEMFANIGGPGAPADSNRVLGNRVGTDAAGSVGAGLGNLDSGIEILSGASNNTIGGITRRTGNLVAGNGGDGVQVLNDDSVRNSILRNSIHSNDELGIDLGIDEVTENDFGMGNEGHDLDLGPNGLQNFPVITELGPAAGRVKFGLQSTANARFRVEVFYSDSEDPTDFGEGQRFRGAKVVRTNANGTVEAVLRIENPESSPVTLTATRLGPDDDPRDTSEFSEAQEDQ